MEFKLDEKQMEIFQEWKKKQEEKARTKDCTGFRYTFCFTPVSLGMCINVVDRVTKEELELTEEF